MPHPLQPHSDTSPYGVANGKMGYNHILQQSSSHAVCLQLGSLQMP